ncbi:glycosyl transferase [Gluconacetobacter entanii]|uniref:Glycosyl transferase n=1 Tax=Gluconacetobacter entanii TaxID=108528 RepID=A0ABT3K9R8_9PROT|nr:glucoamylase family protein [Gluconacetobacter entanii]MCW4592173.1 glycosyl transferase [Gluconacetobacter entanii]MCW4595818.1 glycosyl transferase [Gluconacetobacter entanii]NPC87388.1 glycosyl transferase [Gluconacetobacter entanii]
MDAHPASTSAPSPAAASVWSGFLRRISRHDPSQAWEADSFPVRSEIFGAERLEEHARSLARAQSVVPLSRRTHRWGLQPLSHRLARNSAFLRDAERRIAKAITQEQQLTPAAQWLADNYALVDMQIREITLDLPPGYYARLPKLANGPFAGLPRIFAVAWAYVAHTDSNLQPDVLRGYLLAYQEVEALTIGELWAVPITLRIVLIENLRRVVQAIMHNNADRRAADLLAEQMAQARKDGHPALSSLLASVDPAMLTPAFSAQMAHCLRGLDPEKDAAFVWLEQRLSDRGSTIDAAVRDDLHEQGAFNATIRNIITSLRLIAGLDWTEAFERICLVDRVFAGYDSFTQADFASRDLYRKAIEELARGCARTEMDIAQAAVSLARTARQDHPDDPRRGDPGYYLLMDGRQILEQVLGFRPTPFMRMVRGGCRWGIAGYSGAVTLLALLFLAVPVWFSSSVDTAMPWVMVVAFIAFVPTTDAAVACINRLALQAIRVMALPGLDLSEGIPQHLRTMVVMPVMLVTEETVAELVARLEVHYLATRDDAVHFALLSDWRDHDSAHAPDDDALLALAAQGIDRLNRRHGAASGGPRFMLLHRRRVWCNSERIWMGWERKRGKLHELNLLLRGGRNTTFLPDPARVLPDDVRYVITLDADTRLPLETVRRLVGKMAHPLNLPRFDPVTARVCEGYAILQPRVTPALPVGHKSTIFQRAFSSASGIDAYSAAVSDLYQDMFGEGSYAGKGIYDIDAFEAALAHRVPDSTLLSHDLFEGIFARAGLASDIEVVEDSPTDYLVAVQRLHRWTRGDWQLLPWIFSGFGGHTDPRRRLSGIARWKMADNLRRTLGAPLVLLAFFACWFLPLPLAAIWTLFILAMMALPVFLPVLADFVPRREWITLRSYGSVLLADSRDALVVVLLNITFAAHLAYLMGDAIVRTLIRVCVTHRNLLQWVPAAQTLPTARPGVAVYYRRMLSAPLLCLFMVDMVTRFAAWSLFVALPLAVVWGASPVVAMWVSRFPVTAARSRPSRTDIRSLRMTARRTWRFFETFVTPADHMLPPDNFQEDPDAILAHRTSPTNIGLYLLCCISARDFGWAGLADTLDRVEATFVTLASMPRYRGHFYNWYDTSDLTLLEPAYISTVDSGNMAGHLVALASTCRMWRRDRGGPCASWREGVADALNIAITDLTFRDGARLSLSLGQRRLLRALAGLKTAILSAPQVPSAAQLAVLQSRARVVSELAVGTGRGPDDTAAGWRADPGFWAGAALRSLESHMRDMAPDGGNALDARLEALEHTARGMAQDMEFGFLCNESRKLLSIGFVVSEEAQDSNCYDLLASEARLAVFFAIAKGDMPARNWFRLGRAITPVGNGAALVSWSGSMFEYLMPSLVMRAPIGSLLEQTNRLVVQCQIAYGQGRGIPWGISESAYNVRDLEYTYQYSNFGVPGLGLKRGLGNDTVVAPYATMLAAMVDPQKAVANLSALDRLGAQGRYGFYESLDYTPQRVPDRERMAIVRAYMAHHQGMSILAVADTVMNGIMRARFHDDPTIASAELLLQERAPRTGAVARALPSEEAAPAPSHAQATAGGRYYATADTPQPVTHLLSNGRYTVMLSAAGSGYSRWQGQAITRWREDPTLDDTGSYVYLRNVRTGQAWSAGLQPCGVRADEYAVMFHEDRAEFARRDGDVTTMMEVMVSAEDDVEVRQVSLFNGGSETLEIEVTSYAELALIAQAADLAHPAFTKLFVQTEYLPESRALLATRRRRTPEEPEIWAAHLAVCATPVQVETDRAHFVGRGHGVRLPHALLPEGTMSGRTGTVLDAVFAIRSTLLIKPGAMTRITFWTLVAASRTELLDLIDTHRDAVAFERVRMLAWTQAQVQLRHLDITPADADLFQRLAGHIIYAGPALRADTQSIRAGAGAQPALWEQGISGDLPIVLLRIHDNANTDVVRHLLQAQEYFRLKQLAVDIVILNEHPSSYLQDLQASLEDMVRASGRVAAGAGSVRILRADLISPALHDLLVSVARVVLSARQSLAEQLGHAETLPPPHPAATQVARRTAPPGPDMAARGGPVVPELEFFNGFGGFAENGREYEVILSPGCTTPAPWVNVIANDDFGCQISAEGTGYTWALNSREHQLTPWSNDPVADRGGEIFYFHDQDTHDLWCPNAATRRDAGATYVTRHGWGHTRQERVAHGIASTVVQYVPESDPVKISRIQLHNLSPRPRTLSITAYVEWVLGAARGNAAPFVITWLDPQTGALFACNRWDATYGRRIAFLDIGGYRTAACGDRRAFVGRNGTLDAPAAFTRADGVAGALGAGLDPCGVLQTLVTLPPDGRVETVCLLGEAQDEDTARALVLKYRAADPDAVLRGVMARWEALTRSMQVRTPDRAMDIMLNGWLLYQTLSSRVRARAGFYQASGAFGFRDQLQDGMALAVASPARVREHLLRAASRQFVEGDVQHWWLPQTGAGVRTHISDDCAWLAYTVAHYVRTTGDRAILEEQVPFLDAPPLPITEHDRFMVPAVSAEVASLFEHCARALEHSMAVGAHGLPLMGTGDWNDGMNRVGEKGRGESVWLGWFLHAALMAFIPLARECGAGARADVWQAHANALAQALEAAWDGDWYLRAYFDDGTPLGSHLDRECRIDAISQSWSVLSGVATPERAAHAMQSALQHLTGHPQGLVLVLAPPFEGAGPDPGYISGYPPGIRENGGQYTHAALWTVMAVAALHDGTRAHGLFHELLPITHARTMRDARTYLLEPYVVAADIYSRPPHQGRGGWSWYTGSAGWMQRVGCETILGIHVEGTELCIDPCIPADWSAFEVELAWRTARYAIRVENPNHVCRGVTRLVVDGQPMGESRRITMLDDARQHTVSVTLG